MMKREITAEYRQELTGVENEIKGLDLEATEHFCHDLNQRIALLRRAYDFCDTDVFVLTSMGMLKSGKSTLVSLLAGDKNASPTGFGVDTTRRPALIVAAEAGAEGRIDIWRAKDLSGKECASSEQDQFERVLLFERNGDPRPADCRVLTPENLKYALCENFGLFVKIGHGRRNEKTRTSLLSAA